MHPSVDSERNGCCPYSFKLDEFRYSSKSKKSLQFSAGWLASNLRALLQLKPNDVFMLIEKEEKDFEGRLWPTKGLGFIFEEKRTSQWRIEKSGLFQNISSSLLLKKELDYYYSLSLSLLAACLCERNASNGSNTQWRRCMGNIYYLCDNSKVYTHYKTFLFSLGKKDLRSAMMPWRDSVCWHHRHCVVLYISYSFSLMLVYVHSTRFCTSLVPFFFLVVLQLCLCLFFSSLSLSLSVLLGCCWGFDCFTLGTWNDRGSHNIERQKQKSCFLLLLFVGRDDTLTVHHFFWSGWLDGIRATHDNNRS